MCLLFISVVIWTKLRFFPWEKTQHTQWRVCVVALCRNVSPRSATVNNQSDSLWDFKELERAAQHLQLNEKSQRRRKQEGDLKVVIKMGRQKIMLHTLFWLRSDMLCVFVFFSVTPVFLHGWFHTCFAHIHIKHTHTHTHTHTHRHTRLTMEQRTSFSYCSLCVLSSCPQATATGLSSIH